MKYTSQALPLARRIEHFLSNWQKIIQDEWVLNTISGYRIEFLRKLYDERDHLQLSLQKRRKNACGQKAKAC
jgi:hypothetical protein